MDITVRRYIHPYAGGRPPQPLPNWERRVESYLRRVREVGDSLEVTKPLQWRTGHQQPRPRCACCAETKVVGVTVGVPYCERHAELVTQAVEKWVD